MNETTDTAAFARRRANFFSGTKRDPLRNADTQDAYSVVDDHLITRAEEQLTTTLQSIAQTIGLSGLLSGEVDAMVKKAAPQIKGMSRQDLKALNSSSSALMSLAITAFTPAITLDAAQRMKFQQLKDAHNGTGIAPTDAQLERGTGGTLLSLSNRQAADRRVRDFDTLQTSASLKSITPINFTGSVYDREGMGYQTFIMLRGQGFAQTHIQHAAQDSRINGFSADDPKIAKAFAVLDRDDGARRDERNKRLKSFREQLSKDEEIERLKALRDKATGDERRALDEQLIARGLQLSQANGMRQFLDKAPTAAAREQGRVIEMETIKKITGANIELQNKVGDEVTRNGTDAQHSQEVQAAVGKTNGRQPPMAEAARNDRERAPDDVFGALAALGSPATSPPQGLDDKQGKQHQANVPEVSPTKAAEAAPPKDVKIVQAANTKPQPQAKTATPTMKV
ncbi:MAG: hypothetical protein ABL901_17865 [Hyphomicrobiaceae bacterium]